MERTSFRSSRPSSGTSRARWRRSHQNRFIRCAATGRIARRRAASGRVAGLCTASGRVGFGARRFRARRWIRAQQLQGASLERRAQLQGASLDGASIGATTFSGAFLWCTGWGKIDPADLEAVQFDATLKRWKPVWQVKLNSDPVPWDAKDYEALRDSMNSIPEGKMRDEALQRIKILDCGKTENTLVSCDPGAVSPRKALDWQKQFARASVDDAAFEKALAMELRVLVCTDKSDNTIYLLRGIIKSGRLAATVGEPPRLSKTSSKSVRFPPR